MTVDGKVIRCMMPRKPEAITICSLQLTQKNLCPLVNGIQRVSFTTMVMLFIQGIDGTGFEFSNDYGGFGAQAMAGVTLAASSNVGLYGEAVYNWTSVDADFYDPFYNVVIHESLNYDGWACHGGLRFRF